MKSLLVIEQEPVLAEVTAFRLELLGYSVQIAHTCDQAINLLSSSTPDLVMLDLDMPDGLVLLERMASQSETSALPKLALSLRDELDLVQKAFAAGATDYLVVPYDPMVMQEKVARLLEGKPETQAREKVAKS